MTTISLPLPEPVLVEVPYKGKYVVWPATRDQVRRCLALDPAEDMVDPLKLSEIRMQQCKILCERSGEVESEEPLKYDTARSLPVEALNGEQSAQLARGLLHYHLGQDPAQAEALHQVKKNAALLERVLKTSGAGAFCDLMETLAQSQRTSSADPAKPPA